MAKKKSIPYYKTNVTITVTEASLLEMRKYLFRHSISLREFFENIGHLCSMRDERMESIANDLHDKKSIEIAKGEIEDSRIIDINNLYDAIEAKIKLEEDSNGKNE